MRFSMPAEWFVTSCIGLELSPTGLHQACAVVIDSNGEAVRSVLCTGEGPQGARNALKDFMDREYPLIRERA